MKRVTTMTVEEYREIRKRSRNKHNARAVRIDGLRFDSQREAARYGELRLLESAGEIRDLVIHPRYVLQERFKDAHSGKWIRQVTYTPDFAYVENGRKVVEDVKGPSTMTDAFSVRRRWFQKQNPDVEFRVIS